MNSQIQQKLAHITDEQLFVEAARRLKENIESATGSKFTYGQMEFIFHAGHFSRIDCRPSLRAYTSHEKGMIFNPGGNRER